VGPNDGALESADTLEQTKQAAPAQPVDRAAGPPGPGTRIGRFIVLDELGAGGMAFVLAAYDPDLDRRVALKILRADREGSIGAKARERLLREARAMARLAHPNVIVVHEVGLYAGQVFVAMEYADAGTLKAWCRAERRSPREILARFLAAGRGLLAAHEAGMVHRDFKPANVLLTQGGAAVKVADFGLVGAGAVEGAPAVDAGAIGEAVFGSTLTVAGSVIGTPSYMAPEQHNAQRVGPAADQFAFCVALWEALHGEPPFRGASYAELKRRASSGEVVEPPGAPDVPPWIRAVLQRGLRPRPEDRFPSMRELLAALEADPQSARRRRGRAALAAASVAALVAIAVLGLVRGLAPEREGPCAGAEERLASVWGDGRRAALRGSFLGAGAPVYAADTTARVLEGIDRWAAGWVAARRDACEATHVRGEQSPAALDLRMRCLDRRLGELDALVDVLATPGVLDRAVEATAKLSPVEACADVEALAQAVPPPEDPAARARLEALRARLDRVKALEQAGRYADGAAAAGPLVVEAEALGYAPVLAEARYRHARMHMGTGAGARAEALLWQALSDASAARDDALVVRAWADLLYAVAYMQNRSDHAALLRPAAEAAARRVAEDAEAAVSLANSLGLIHFVKGEHAAAREHIARAVELRERHVGAVHPDVASGLNNLGSVLEAEGRYEEAIAVMRRALAMKERTVGPAHPSVGHALNNLGVALVKLRRGAEARPHLERAVALWQAALGAEHAHVATAQHNLGTALEATGDLAGAKARLEAALAIRRKVLGPEHAHVALSLTVLARLEAALGAAPRAVELAEEALRLRRARPGEAALLAETQLALARALWEAGRDRPRARRLAEEARAAYAAGGPRWASELEAVDAWLAARPR
jgi:tetratricopeptide (TPR) repeat protein/tRNA A-37 threonylcarbamoyl transferase component Bud32